MTTPSRALVADLAMGHVNVIWQGDANSQARRALAHCTAPTSGLNASATEATSSRALATALGERLGIAPLFAGTESDTAWRVDTAEARRLSGLPEMPLARMIDWTADWIARRMPSLGKDTPYDVRDGNY